MTNSSTPPRGIWLGYDLEDRFAEVLFALATMLIFTLAVERLVSPDAAGVHALLVSTLGYSLIWAVFVGVMYAVHAIDRRGRIARFAQAYRIRPNEAQALDAIGHELESTLVSLTNEYMRERLHWQILSNISMLEPGRVHLKTRDLYGALTTFGIVFAATIPVALPFLFCTNPWVAVRISNLLTIALLCACSYMWASHTRVRPWMASILFAGLGIAAVWVAVSFL